jgi:hypothetical protein
VRLGWGFNLPGPFWVGGRIGGGGLVGIFAWLVVVTVVVGAVIVLTGLILAAAIVLILWVLTLFVINLIKASFGSSGSVPRAGRSGPPDVLSPTQKAQRAARAKVDEEGGPMIVMSNGYRLRHDLSSADDFRAFVDGKYVGAYIDGRFVFAKGTTTEESSGLVAAGEERLAELVQRPGR